MPSKRHYSSNPDKYRLEAASYYAKNREKRLAYARRYRQSKRYKDKMVGHYVKYHHRLTRRLYLDIVERQGGACAVCRSTRPRRKKMRLCVDHDHSTGAIRGLVCNACNLAIGFARDNPELLRKLATYLEQPPITFEPHVVRKRRTSAEIKVLLATT